jgi:endogenous inhibitor of DNA gyrase (YacG/DUF329 family)
MLKGTWYRFLLVRWLYCGVLCAFLFGGALDAHLRSVTFSVFFGVGMFAALWVVNFYYMFIPCPRCNAPFYWDEQKGFKPFVARCRNCGLEKWKSWPSHIHTTEEISEPRS